MAASFKLPSLAKRPRRRLNFPEFNWREVQIMEVLGRGKFGSICVMNESNGILPLLKKLKGESTRILTTVKVTEI